MKIIRTKPLSDGDSSFVETWCEVINKTSTHIEIKTSYGGTAVLLLEKRNDGNWVRWK